MPLDFIPVPKRLPLFWLFFGLTVAFFGVFNWLDQPLRTSAAPSGIVSYELAGSHETANAMLASWGESARLSVAFGLGLDFLFMPLYAALCRSLESLGSFSGKSSGVGSLSRDRIRCSREHLLFHILEWLFRQ